MRDAEFVAALESCTLPPELFDHRAHVRLAWLYLRAEPYEAALERMEQSIRRYAGRLGASRKYHRTITVAWMRLVAAAAAKTSPAMDFDAFVQARPHLLESGALRRHYSAERLASAEARVAALEPDLEPLPDGLSTCQPPSAARSASWPASAS